MPPCQICGDNSGLGYTCNECGGKYCSDHRLPEAHRCDALSFTISKNPTDTSEKDASPSDTESADSTDTGWEIRPGYRNPENRTGDRTHSDSGYKPESTHPASPEHQPGGGPTRRGTRRGEQATNNIDSNAGGSPVSTLLTYLLAPLVLVWWWKKPLLLLGLVVLGASLAPGIPPESFLSPSDTAAIRDTADSIVAGPTTVTTSASGDAAAATQTTTSAPTTTTTADTIVSEAEIETAIHARVNEIRTSRGLSTLRIQSSFTTAARGHSREMADRGELYHGDIRARYGSQCSAVGENVAYTYADANIRTSDGELVNHDGNETKIAHGIVRGWMNSPGHRENILRGRWYAEGIGVNTTTVDGKTRVYATQGFCGN